jgi:uncharacterized membrane protein YecN with MAPEG domain
VCYRCSYAYSRFEGGDLNAVEAYLIDYMSRYVWAIFVVGQSLKASRLLHTPHAFTRVFIFEANGDEIGVCFAARA